MGFSLFLDTFGHMLTCADFGTCGNYVTHVYIFLYFGDIPSPRNERYKK